VFLLSVCAVYCHALVCHTRHALVSRYRRRTNKFSKLEVRKSPLSFSVVYDRASQTMVATPNGVAICNFGIAKEIGLTNQIQRFLQTLQEI